MPSLVGIVWKTTEILHIVQRVALGVESYSEKQKFPSLQRGYNQQQQTHVNLTSRVQHRHKLELIIHVVP